MPDMRRVIFLVSIVSGVQYMYDYEEEVEYIPEPEYNSEFYEYETTPLVDSTMKLI